jgi:hypothetical protein
MTDFQSLATTLVAATATIACSNTFYLQAQGSSANAQYVVLPGSDDETITSFTSTINNAAIFSIDSNGYLFNGPYRANTDTFSPATIFFDLPGEFTGAPSVTCTLPGRASGSLSCTGYEPAANTFQLCPGGCNTGGEPCGGLSLGTAVDSRCQAISFIAVPVCT